jgi:sec-independent protein translocase protein TatA
MFRNIADNPLLLIVLLLVIVVVFGANKLPTAARSLGRSMRIFKSEVTALREDDEPGAPSADTGKRTHAAGAPTAGAGSRDIPAKDAATPDPATSEGSARPVKRSPEAVEGRIVDPPDGAPR